MAGTNGSTATSDRAQVERALDRLEEPVNAAALHRLIDNLPLIAMLVQSTDELLRRGEELAANVNGALAELRRETERADTDLVGTAKQLATLIPALHAAVPAIRTVVGSGIVEPEPVAVLSGAANALVDALGTANRVQLQATPTVLLKSLRDPDVQLGLGYLILAARAFGQQIKAGEVARRASLGA